MRRTYLKPTPDQTFVVAGEGAGDFGRVLARSRELQGRGEVEEACNERFHAFQRFCELLPEDEEVLFEWSDPRTRAALEVVYASAIDHFLIDDFEMSAAMLEQLLEVDPEDHFEATVLLAFDYLALDEFDSFDEICDDLADDARKVLLLMWSAFRRSGCIPREEAARFGTCFAAYRAEFTADRHPADERYLRDIESERPSAEAQARELWLRTENLWALHPDFIAALREA